jgi:hypothetical protein
MTRSTSAAAPAPSGKVRKLIMQMLVGALFGFATMFLLLNGLGKEVLRQSGPDGIAAIGVGVVYCLIGLFVGLGTAFPGPGAKLLNVDGEEEILEERHMFSWSSVAMILIGIAPIALALAAPKVAMISTTAAAIIFVISLIGQIAVAYITRNDADEFAQKMSSDSSVVFAGVLTMVFGTWAALAHLGYVAMFSGLAFVAGTLALFLLAIFWVTGRQGLLLPK